MGIPLEIVLVGGPRDGERVAIDTDRTRHGTRIYVANAVPAAFAAPLDPLGTGDLRLQRVPVYEHAYRVDHKAERGWYVKGSETPSGPPDGDEFT